MKTMKIASLIILLLVPVLLFACATAKSQYEDARKINTISAYQEFLGKYPSGEYAEMAQTRIEALNFEKAQTVNSVEAYESFLLSSNNDLFKTYAIQRIQKIYRDEYLKTKAIDSVEAYERYMTTYPKSDYLPRCLERVEDLEWGRALRRHDALGYYHYLNHCRVCEKHKQEARKRLTHYIKSGAVVDPSSVKDKIEKILNRSDIVVVQTGADKITTQTGPMRIEDLSSAAEVLVSIMTERKSVSAEDLAKGNYASVKTLRLKNRVPISEDNAMGFSTIIFYSAKRAATEILFIEGGRGYLFKETDAVVD